MRYFLIGDKKNITKYLGKNEPTDIYEIKGGILAVIVEKLPHKASSEEIVGVSVVSEEKFVRFLESNEGKPKHEKKEESVQTE